MLHVVLDTNVAVSGLLSSHGKPAEVLNMFSELKYKAYYSPEILAEYISVLSRSRFNFDKRDVASFIGGMQRFGVLVEPPVSDIPFADESDRIFYDLARSCDALLVTGNLKHYPIETFIVTPAEFLNLLSESEEPL